jgi:DNA polymerase III sliding clamp (beta) subunit (PCNA family)
MQKNNVGIGKTYYANVGSKELVVRIERKLDGGGWMATNLTTRRQVKIKSADRLSRVEVSAEEKRMVFHGRELIETLTAAKKFMISSTHPTILSSVLIESVGEFAVITGTSLDETYKRKIKCEGSKFTMCIPVGVLLEEVKAQACLGAVVITVLDEKTVYINGRCKLHIRPADEFPDVGGIGELQGNFKVEGLSDVLNKTHRATSKDAVRYVQVGVTFMPKDGVAFGTDGHRMHVAHYQKQQGRDSFMIPSKVAAIIYKTVEDEVKIYRQHIKFKALGSEVIVRKLSNNLADYKAVIPSKPGKHHITVEAMALMSVLDEAEPVTEDDKKQVVITALRLTSSAPPDSGVMRIEATSKDVGEYKWEIPCKLRGGDIRFAMNANYIRDAAVLLEGDDFTFESDGPNNIFRVNGDAYIMPKVPKYAG